MKYVFFLLVAINIALFAWQWFSPSPTAPVTVTSAATRAPEVPSIRLLTERAGATSEREQRLSQAISRPVVQGDSECLALGPFRDVFSGQDVTDQLLALEIPTELRAVDRNTENSDYRVMIPPMNTLQEAFRKLRELKSRNIDSFVITQGDDALGISLGVFSSRSAAESAQAARQRDGDRVVVVEIPRFERTFWIFSAEAQDLLLSPPLLARLRSDHGDIREERLPCPNG